MVFTTTVYSRLIDPQGRSVARRPVTVLLVSASRSVRDQATTLAINGRTLTDDLGDYAIPLVPNSDVADLGSYYLVREWEVGERAIVVPPRTDPRVDAQGRVPLGKVVIDQATLLPEPAYRPPMYLLRAERGVLDGVATLDADGKVPAIQLPASSGGSHTHPSGQVSDLAAVATTGAYADLTGRPAIPGTYADLTGTVPAAALPDLAVSDFLGEVADTAAMLALTGQRGDWCVRADNGTTWLITGDTPAQLASWRQLAYPASPVASVAGRTGVIVLGPDDVGLSNVDDTADVDKPVSTATATALQQRQLRIRREVRRVTSGETAGNPVAGTGGAWAEYTGVGELSIAAAPGDYLEVALGWMRQVEAGVYVDLAVKTAGQYVHYSSTGTSVPAVEGDAALYPTVANLRTEFFGELDVAAEHVDTDGKVHFVLMVKSDGGGGKIYYSPVFQFRWRVLNFPGAAA